RAVDAGAHRSEVALAQVRSDGGTGELSLGQLEAEGLRRPAHLTQVVGADLVSEPARAAVYADDHLVDGELERGGHLRLVDLGDPLHLQIVVPGSQCSHLVLLPRTCPLGDMLWECTCHAATLLGAREILGDTPASRDRPLGSAAEHGLHLIIAEPNATLAAHAGRDAMKQGV